MVEDVLRDRVGEGAFVEHLAALLGDQLERPGKVVLEQPVFGDETLAVILLVHVTGLGRVAQDQVEDRVQICLSVVELDAASRECDRGLKEVAPRK